MTKILALALLGLAVVAAPAIAADSKEKKEAPKAAPVTGKAPDKGSQGGIILQNSQKGPDKGAKGGIILQNSQKGPDKGAKGGIILQNNAGKSTNTRAPAAKGTATPGG